MSEAEKDARRQRYLDRWRDLSSEWIAWREVRTRRWRAFANFVLQRGHDHSWTRAAEVAVVPGLGAKLQFHRFCYCGRAQYMIEWWNQFEEPCYG